MNFCRLISLLIITLLAVADPILAAQWSPSLSTVIQDANKEGKLKLMWGEGTLGGTKGAAKFETMMNKMFGTNIKIGFTPGAAMPQMGSQIAAEYAAGQSAASDVYIGADSYLAPLVKRKLFHEVDWPETAARPDHQRDGRRRAHELESLYGIARHPLQYAANAQKRGSQIAQRYA